MACLCEQTAGNLETSPNCIGKLWAFQDLPRKELMATVKEATRRKIKKGDTVFMQGDAADEVFLIKGGRIKLTKVLENGTELMLDLRRAGAFVGENMFSEEGEYPVSAVCLEDTLTCGFTRKQFEELVPKHPKVGLQVIKTLSERISWLTTRVGNLTVTNIEDRLYRMLKNVAKDHGAKSPQGVVIQFPLTHEDLSLLARAHRVTISRAMKALKDAGKIILENKLLILPELDAA
ncbi:Crp/Fnr family transcriptional regulator [Desulfobacter hydrogenophilus]|uniref:Crp/Fnr family transcriptional regulator n=1 Tax=Desulfobacter hydrogenophilus TaxID=2291 RepID=A0A328FH13_9BACT|nr:Crp/Fnr family transcriptional regulator [Desulfobacter hydrogenophilus]NDY72268.1 Crp/Fnr family transcriptional regulator [Desulfobacter hydrogenophilus]QBH12896.1 Crp/Fnr family transcriptional regulator [Desulfobacter hydrogenophilus]RAM03881.1 Crp/Fnr family transcriptional regulator [Desulfobacter hydrogenophilus]